MPHVVNGIGTWYYGKKNLERIYSTCEFCGKDAYLHSYDTGLYFVVVFVPLIPLGKKRILSECTSCKKHQSVKLSKFEASKKRILEDSISEIKNSARDSEKVREAVLAVLSYKDRDAFNECVNAVSQAGISSEEVEGTIAAGYEMFGNARSGCRVAKKSFIAFRF